MPAPRLQDRYRTQVAPRLQEEFGYRNVMEVPRVTKVIVNIGMGEAIANFKIRTGNAIGVACTLRGVRMWEFLDRTLNAALPRIRDFQGVSRTAFDGRGNYSLGLREQIVFPEIDYGTVDRIRGLQIVIVTTARRDEEARRLLELLGMPFARTA